MPSVAKKASAPLPLGREGVVGGPMLHLSRVPGGGGIGLHPPSNAAGGAGRASLPEASSLRPTPAPALEKALYDPLSSGAPAPAGAAVSQEIGGRRPLGAPAPEALPAFDAAAWRTAAAARPLTAVSGGTAADD